MNIIIITGGMGAEREVSLASARNIQNILNIPNHNVFDYPKNKSRIIEVQDNIDVVIPMIHGEGGEDGEVQLFLKKLNIPYLFSTPEVHKNCLNKRRTKALLKKKGIRSAREFSPNDDITKAVFIKPLHGGSSVLTKKTTSQKEMVNFVKEHNDTSFIIEEAIEGREFSVGVVETLKGIAPLSIIEIISNNEFFDYENKYDEKNLAQEVCPADISDELKTSLHNQALQAHKHMKCKHLSRSDFIVIDTNEIYFLEINTIPGMTKTSLIPKAVTQAECSLDKLFTYWITKEV